VLRKHCQFYITSSPLTSKHFRVLLHIGAVVFNTTVTLGLAVLIAATLARIFIPSAIIILLLLFMTIAKVFVSISSTMVLDGNPRDLGSIYLAIFYVIIMSLLQNKQKAQSVISTIGRNLIKSRKFKIPLCVRNDT